MPIDPAEADQIGITLRRKATGRAVEHVTRIVHTQSEEELTMGCHRKHPLHEVTFGRCLEHQSVGGPEDPREDREVDRRLIVGRRVQNRRASGPAR